MQNYSVRAVLWDYQKNAEEKYRIKLAISVDRQTTYKLTNYRLHVTQWDKESRKVINRDDAKIINVQLARDIADLEKELLLHTLNGITLSKRIIKGNVTVSKKISAYAKEIRLDPVRLKRITDFGGDQVMITDVSVEWLRKFEAWMRKQKLAQNTISTTFKYLNQILAQGKKEKYLIENPFDIFIKPKYVQTERIYLVQDELEKLLDLLNKPLHSSIYNTLCYFLLGCYTGLRHSDWGRYKEIGIFEDGMVKQTAKKNKRHVVVPVGKTLQKILDIIEHQPAPFSNQKCNGYLKAIAAIAGIDKEITTHSARHSFGCMCARLGLPESTTAKLMGINAQTVKVYYHLTGEDIKEQAAILKAI